MKSFNCIVFSILILIFYQSAAGQVNECCGSKNSVTSEPALPGGLFIATGQVNNTTWFNKEWLIADISLSNGEIVRNKYVKYNGLIDELIWHEPDMNISVKLDKSAILQFHILNNQGDTSTYFRRLTVKRDLISDSGEVFAEEIYLDKLSLYVRHTFVIERRELSAKDGVYFQNDIYTEVPVYYFRFINNKTVGLKNLKRKSISAMIPDKKGQINDYYKKNRPGKVFDRNELISLAHFLSSIIYQ